MKRFLGVFLKSAAVSVEIAAGILLSAAIYEKVLGKKVEVVKTSD